MLRLPLAPDTLERRNPDIDLWRPNRVALGMDVKQALLNLSASQLKKALALKERIETLHTELENLLIEAAPGPVQRVMKGKRQMSAAAKKKISEAAKARWARFRAARNK